MRDLDRVNVVVLAQMPTPYRVELWDKIHEKLRLNIICITQKEKNREWDIDQRKYISFLSSFHIFFEKLDWGLHFTLPLSLMYKLVRLNPSIVVIAGYDSMQFWEGLIYAKLFNKKAIMWNGTTLLSGRNKNKVIHALKKIFISSVDGYYTYGSQATKYIKSFGAKNKLIYTGTNTVDITPFINCSVQNEEKTNKTILFVGQLIERKGLKNTFKALSKIKNTNWNLLIAGSGSQEQELKELADELSLSEKITFLGYKQKSEILPYFEESDIFLMPSYNEVWGLVLNEAIASGLFCLSSKYAGSTYDLIKNGENGYVINPLNINEYAEYLEMALGTKINKQQIKKTAIFTIENEANKWVDFLNKF